MKIDNKVLVGLGVIAVVAYIYRDKIFSKKETTTKNEPLSVGMSVMPSSTQINNPNLGLNKPRIMVADSSTFLKQAILQKYGQNYTPQKGDFVNIGADRFEFMSKLEYNGQGGVPNLGSPRWHKWKGDGSDPI
jgi:hypothetical protein